MPTQSKTRQAIDLMRSEGLSQAEAAARVGVSRQAVSAALTYEPTDAPKRGKEKLPNDLGQYQCSVCGTYKDPDQFYTGPTLAGLSSYCRDCYKETTAYKKRRLARLEKHLKQTQKTIDTLRKELKQ